MNPNNIWWIAPEYFSRWRLFPRAFISMYIYLLYRTVMWFQALPAPSMEQAGLVSVIVGAGAAWFGLYVNSTSSKFEPMKVDTTIRGGFEESKNKSTYNTVATTESTDSYTTQDVDEDGVRPLSIKRVKA